MTSSLVGSEMCIRDRRRNTHIHEPTRHHSGMPPERCLVLDYRSTNTPTCLLYTSDAADDM
eukprot:6174372-Prorocentrum_lima.AAC.1